MRYLYYYIVFISLYLISYSGFSQIKVSINSGNPNFPFPQFIDYGSNRQSLASNLPDGLSHAEMEKWIAEAYQIMMNGAEYSNEEIGGVKYIKYDSFIEASEIYGFALQAAAYLGDKQTFDGLWFYVHDHYQLNTQKYLDCENTTTDNYSDKKLINTFKSSNAASSSDIDFDIAFSLLLAWKQWGESSNITSACGTTINYKEEALNLLNDMASLEVLKYTIGFNERYLSGNIGIDGYVKPGNAWGEFSNWESTPYTPTGVNNPMFFYSNAPGYFHCFSKILEQENHDQFIISQYQRAEASGDWLTGQLTQQGYYVTAGMVKMANDGFPRFSQYIDDMDIIPAWRGLINYLWHGHGATSWNPINHTIITTGNTHEYEAAIKLAELLNDPEGCQPNPYFDLRFNGVSTLAGSYDLNGRNQGLYHTNWLLGAASTAAIASQDFSLMAKMFRQLILTWNGTEGYLDSKPLNYDGWYRLLGMLILSGNYYSPSALPNSHNLKIYLDVDKTVVQMGDTLEYIASIKNFGTLPATNIQLRITLPESISFISSDKGSINGKNLTHVINNITSSQSTDNSDTIKIKTVVTRNTFEKINLDVSATIGNTTIKASEFPNILSLNYKKNTVDIIPENLSISKSLDQTEFEPGDLAEIHLKVINNDHPSLHGGRKNVRVSMGRTTDNPTSFSQVFRTELFHDAAEPCIDYGNYRITYFASAKNQYTLSNMGYYNQSKISDVIFSIDSINSQYKALRFQFASDTGIAMNKLLSNSGNYRIHLGNGSFPASLFSIQRNVASPDYSQALTPEDYQKISEEYTNRLNWENDWSWKNNHFHTAKYTFPVSPLFTNTAEGEISFKYLPEICDNATNLIENILIEEWDGFTWRTVAGASPANGQILTNIKLQDQISDYFEFVEVKKGPTPIINNETITWNIPELAPKDSIEIVYLVKVKESLPTCKGIIETETEARLVGKISTYSDKKTIRINCPLITSTSYGKHETIEVYPNPFSSSITVNNTTNSTIEVFNSEGKIVEKIINHHQNPVELGVNLSPGIYFIKITNNSQVAIVKVLKN